MTREMKYPTFEIEGDGDDLRMRFVVAESKFGSVEIVLDASAAEELADSLVQAAAFAGATSGDSDG